MPNLANAKKALRQSQKRQAQNATQKKRLKEVLKAAEKGIADKAANVTELVSAATAVLDKAAKANIIHANKAARHKSQLQKKLSA